jgi:hypothetical protein
MLYSPRIKGYIIEDFCESAFPHGLVKTVIITTYVVTATSVSKRDLPSVRQACSRLLFFSWLQQYYGAPLGPGVSNLPSLCHKGITDRSKVQIKLSLCLIYYAPRHEDVWGSGGIAPVFSTSALR